MILGSVDTGDCSSPTLLRAGLTTAERHAPRQPRR